MGLTQENKVRNRLVPGIGWGFLKVQMQDVRNCLLAPTKRGKTDKRTNKPSTKDPFPLKF